MNQEANRIDGIYSTPLSLRRTTDERFQQERKNAIQYIPDSSEPILLPLPRILLGISGTFMALYGIRRANLDGLFLFTLGIGALIRSITNLGTVQLVGLTLHPTIEMRRAIEIDAPIEVVFRFLRSPSNYSRFMSYVKEVELSNNQKLKWTIVGPAGVRVQWETWVHALFPNLAISWRSVSRSIFMHAGTFSFMSLDQKKTKVELAMAYAPPIGALGYGVIKVIGFDPRDQIDNDLVKMKNIIESEYRISSSSKLNAS